MRELIDRMITRSSNLATNALIELVRADRVNATAHALGARNIRVLRGVEDGKAFRAGLNNTTTARDLAVLLEAIETGTAASRASCDAMRDVLLRQEFNAEIPAGLPPGTKVAHKTGWITGVLHDAAIVYPAGRKPYVLVVLTRGIPDDKVARQLIADISRLVYAHADGAASADQMNIAIGTDHAGFALKATVIDAVRDGRPRRRSTAARSSSRPTTTTPISPQAVARAILDGNARSAAFCSAAAASAASVAANKFDGIRSALCHDTFSARQGVEDDAMNVLALGARVIGPSLAVGGRARLSRAPSSPDAARHRRRLDKVKGSRTR